MQGPKSSNMTNAPFLGLAVCVKRLNNPAFANKSEGAGEVMGDTARDNSPWTRGA